MTLDGFFEVTLGILYDVKDGLLPEKSDFPHFN